MINAVTDFCSPDSSRLIFLWHICTYYAHICTFLVPGVLFVENKNMMVFPLGILVYIPCASLHISFAWEWVHWGSLLPRINAGSLRSCRLQNLLLLRWRGTHIAVVVAKMLEEGVTPNVLGICTANAYCSAVIVYSLGDSVQSDMCISGGRIGLALGL